MLSITKIFRFETAHRISNYKGPCSQIHGHSYELHVTVSGVPSDETDMIIDFKELKKITEEEILSEFDHALILKSGTDTGLEISSKTYYISTEPTAERLLQYIGYKIRHRLPEQVSLRRLKLFETPSSYAEWEAES